MKTMQQNPHIKQEVKSKHVLKIHLGEADLEFSATFMLWKTSSKISPQGRSSKMIAASCTVHHCHDSIIQFPTPKTAAAKCHSSRILLRLQLGTYCLLICVCNNPCQRESILPAFYNARLESCSKAAVIHSLWMLCFH